MCRNCECQEQGYEGHHAGYGGHHGHRMGFGFPLISIEEEVKTLEEMKKDSLAMAHSTLQQRDYVLANQKEVSPPSSQTGSSE